jgi:hypothetical protein
MIFPAFNRYPHRWFMSLSRTDKFTFVVAIFTSLLAISTSLQVLAFIESERAELVIEDATFPRGEPSPDTNGLDLIIRVRNFGKHVANIKMFNITQGVFINNKALPAKPQYHGGSITPVVPPIAPGAEIAVYGEQEPQEFRIPREDVVKGVLDGSIPLRIWGFVEYYTGYSVFGPSEVGYCFTYVPVSHRHTGRFQVCDNPNYIYTR